MKLVLKTRPAKIIIWILAILFAICIAAVAFYLIVVPFGTTGYDFHFGCVEITDDGFEIPPEEYHIDFQCIITMFGICMIERILLAWQ